MRLATVLVGALALRVLLFGGVRVIDHVEMSRHAHRIVEGTYRPSASHYPLRIAFLLPIAAAQSVLGLSDAAGGAVPLVCSMTLIALAYFAGRRAGGPTAALVASGLVALLPLDVILATQPYPDLAAALFSSAAGALLLLGRPSTRNLMVVGILAGAGYLVKETGAFVMALPVILALLRRDPRLLIPVAGFALVVAGEMALWGIWTGDPLLRWKAATAQKSFWSIYYPDSSSVAARLTYELPAVMVGIDFALFFWIVAVSLFVLRRDPLARSLGLWLGLTFAIILVFPLTLSPYRPALIAYSRHLYPLVLPGALTAGLAVARARSRRWGVALAAQALFGFLGAIWIHQMQLRWTEGAREAYRIAAAEKPDVIYTDKIGTTIFDFWGRFRGPTLARHEYEVPSKPGILIDNPIWIEAGGIPPAWRGREAGWTVLWEKSYPRRPTHPFRDPGRYTVRVLRIP